MSSIAAWWKSLSAWIVIPGVALLLLGMDPGPVRAQGQATITGTVVGAEEDRPLVGVSVVLRGEDGTSLVKRTATNSGGTFLLGYLSPGEYVLEVQAVGYKREQRPLLVEMGESRDLHIELERIATALQSVIESASRRQEEVLEAPASVSVLDPVEIRQYVATSSIEALRNTPGVDMAQTGIDRREVVLRGFNDAFSGGSHVLTDHRDAAVPSLGANVYGIMSTPSLDLNRIEVVRGPVSALYGPGAEGGLIHFFSRDPFQEPGTAVSVEGGTRSYFQGQFRQAGVLGDRIGYKFTGQVARAHDWTLDPDTPQDAEEIDRYRIYETREAVPAGRTVSDLDRDGDGNVDAFRLRRDDLYNKYNVNGLLEYRYDGGTTLSLRGGYAELKSVLQSDIGTLQANGFGYSYGQLRLDSGDFVGQVFLNRNHSRGDMYIYGSGQSLLYRGLQWNAQLKYFFDVEALNTQGVAGAEANLVRPRTEGEVLGRNEGQDNINELGTYAQTTTQLTSDLELTLAARADHNNVIGDLRLSPRAALVYSVTPQHSLRASYNQGISSPGVNSYFLDIEAQRRSFLGDRALVYQARGAADGFSFDNFRESNDARFFLPTPNVPGDLFGQSLPLGRFPVLPTYSAAARQFQQQLQQADPPFMEPLLDLSPPALQAYRQLLEALARSAGGSSFTSETVLGIPEEGNALGYRSVDGPLDISPLQQSTTQTLGLGYKGALGGRIQLRVDGYYERKEDVIGPLRVESPFVYLNPEFIAEDVQSRLQFDGPSQVAFQEFLSASRLSEERALEVLTNTFGRTASAVVQPDQQVLPGGGGANEVGAVLSYRNFGELEYWGLDAAVEVDATDALEVFGNISFVSDDFFTNEELDAVDEALSVALNAPSFKLKGGLDYGLPAGVTVGLTGRYVDGFPVRSGPYVGEIESYVVFDARVGYDLPAVPGLRVDATVRNVLDNQHREFVGAPALGRLGMVRLTYELP